MTETAGTADATSSPRAPFQVTTTGEFAAILAALGKTLVVASYNSGLLLLASAMPSGLVLLSRAFDKPMSIAARGTELVVATRNDLIHFAASRSLAPGMPRSPNTYDVLWLPRSVAFTGEIDLHDIDATGPAPLGVATRFSCVARFDNSASFVPVWRPPFITDTTPEDRCHLNGLAVDAAGAPRFVTMLGASDTAQGWRQGRVTGGVLMSVPEGRVVQDGLCMPHSPRLVGEDLLFLNSGAGEVVRMANAKGEPQVLARLSGYTRGFAAHGDLLFVGLSCLRDRHGAGNQELPVERGGTPLSCGVAVLDRQSGRVLGEMRLSGSVNEVSDLALLEGPGRHGLISHTDALHRDALALPEMGFWSVPEKDAQKHPPVH
jgi:uncharacterized protein (TIGR03032 family)